MHIRFILSIGLLLLICSCSKEIRAPSDFALRITDYAGTIDTFKGTFTVRGIRIRKPEEYGEMFRDTTIQFEFTQPQKDSIYRMIGDTHFFMLPTKLTPVCDDYIMPSSNDNLFVRCNGISHKVEFENRCITGDKRTKEFQYLLNYIYSIVYRHPEVRKLPDSLLVIF